LSCSISLISTIVYISGITLNNLHQPGSFKRLGRTIIIKSSSASLFQKIGKNNNSKVFTSQALKRLGRTIILKSSSARLSKDWEEQ
jgi:hypothetical protein